MTPGVRKGGLVMHVVSSVGWLGAVATSLALGVAGLVSGDRAMVRAAWVTLEWVGWYVLVPLSIASLLTGVVQSLGTAWGLFRHHWVLIKLVLNVAATAILLLYMRTLTGLADLARDVPPGGDPAGLRDPSPTVHGVGALVALLVATVLSVYKPRGLTSYGRRVRLAAVGVPGR